MGLGEGSHDVTSSCTGREMRPERVHIPACSDPPARSSCTCSIYPTIAVSLSPAVPSTLKHLSSSPDTMDIYDHIQEENYKENEGSAERAQQTQANLNEEFQEAYKAISSSPWGTTIGGLWATAKKQVGDSIYVHQLHI